MCKPRGTVPGIMHSLDNNRQGHALCWPWAYTASKDMVLFSWDGALLRGPCSLCELVLWRLTSPERHGKAPLKTRNLT